MTVSDSVRCQMNNEMIVRCQVTGEQLKYLTVMSEDGNLRRRQFDNVTSIEVRVTESVIVMSDLSSLALETDVLTVSSKASFPM